MLPFFSEEIIKAYNICLRMKLSTDVLIYKLICLRTHMFIDAIIYGHICPQMHLSIYVFIYRQIICRRICLRMLLLLTKLFKFTLANKTPKAVT